MSQIQINQIQLDLRGVPSGVAQTALATLGPALHQAIAEQTAGRTAASSVQIERVSAAPLRVAQTIDATGLRDTLARHLASTIAGQLNPPGRL